MMYARARQRRCIHKNADCQLKDGACVKAMTLKKPKTRLKFYKVFKTRKLRGTVVKVHFSTKYALYENGLRSGR